MALNSTGEILHSPDKIVHLETECKDCFSISHLSKKLYSQCFALVPLNTGLSPWKNSVVCCQQSLLLMQAQQIGPGSVSHPSLWASFFSVHLPNFFDIGNEIT